MTNDLVGAAEVAKVLGVSRQRVAQLASSSSSNFPAPEAHLGAGRIWRRANIEAWASAHPDRGPGRRSVSTSAASLAPAIHELVGIAASQALELNHSWLGVDHLLLAVLHPNCGGQASVALESLGVSFDTARALLVASFGDDYTTPPLYLTWTPNAQLVLQRAVFECAEMADEEVESEHVLLALTRAWDSAPLSGELGQLGISAEAVRERVVAATEGRLEEFVSVAPIALPANRESHGPPRALLAENPLGLHPNDRGPWGSAVFCDENGRPITMGQRLAQYFVDRDGHPVLTTEGRPVHIVTDDQGAPVKDSKGELLVGAVPVPDGSRVLP